MIISKYGKSYDTSNGSEQQFGPARRRGPGDGEAARARWEDDGGRLTRPRAARFAHKPEWSVLSLPDLNEAIRRANDPDDPAQVRQESRRVECARLRSVQIEDAKAAAAARAHRDRYRNAWEHS
jgi:hypothetical protein